MSLTPESDPERPGCPSCRELQTEVFRLTMERQQLVELLASERERANALFVSYPPQGHTPDSGPAHYEPPIDKPLRYRIADKLNDALRARLGPLHKVARGGVLSLVRGNRG